MDQKKRSLYQKQSKRIIPYLAGFYGIVYQIPISRLSQTCYTVIMSITVRKKGSEINLLPQEGFATTTTGRILLWLLSSFRIIVIVTEIIVMVAFLSRFVLDTNNTDLNEEMIEKRALIAAQRSFENEFKSTQNKLSIYKDLSVRKSPVSDTLTSIVTSLPSDAFLDQLTFRNDGATISGYSSNERSIQQFIVNLENKQDFGSVSLSGLNSNTDNPSLLEFDITVVYTI